jgi:predicted ribosome quality control (RQC) complex YloA/Tae2 family protein
MLKQILEDLEVYEFEGKEWYTVMEVFEKLNVRYQGAAQLQINRVPEEEIYFALGANIRKKERKVFVSAKGVVYFIMTYKPRTASKESLKFLNKLRKHIVDSLF